MFGRTFYKRSVNHLYNQLKFGAISWMYLFCKVCDPLQQIVVQVEITCLKYWLCVLLTCAAVPFFHVYTIPHLCIWRHFQLHIFMINTYSITKGSSSSFSVMHPTCVLSFYQFIRYIGMWPIFYAKISILYIYLTLLLLVQYLCRCNIFLIEYHNVFYHVCIAINFFEQCTAWSYLCMFHNI